MVSLVYDPKYGPAKLDEDPTSVDENSKRDYSASPKYGPNNVHEDALSVDEHLKYGPMKVNDKTPSVEETLKYGPKKKVNEDTPSVDENSKRDDSSSKGTVAPLSQSLFVLMKLFSSIRSRD